MQNVLLTAAEGHGATGLALLREALARTWPTVRPTILLPQHPLPLSSFATSPDFMSAPLEQVEANVTLIDATPCDVLRRAFLDHERWSPRPWDVVLVGVTPNAVAGTDVFAHANTATAMLAANAFLAYAVVFNQERRPETDPEDRLLYGPAERIIPHFLKTTPVERARAWNVNIPGASVHHRGYRETNTAHYSPTAPPPTVLVPRARDENSDVTALAEGFTAITSLTLRVNPALRY